MTLTRAQTEVAKMIEEKPEQTPREIIEKLHAMSPEEFNQFMHEHFARLCKQPLPDSSHDQNTHTGE